MGLRDTWIARSYGGDPTWRWLRLVRIAVALALVVSLGATLAGVSGAEWVLAVTVSANLILFLAMVWRGFVVSRHRS